MSSLAYSHVMILSAILFVLGVFGFLVRRNILFMFLSIEVMLNAAGLAFVAGALKTADPGGQIMFILILSAAAAEIALGIALVFACSRKFNTLNVEVLSRGRG